MSTENTSHSSSNANNWIHFKMIAVVAPAEMPTSTILWGLFSLISPHKNAESKTDISGWFPGQSYVDLHTALGS